MRMKDFRKYLIENDIDFEIAFNRRIVISLNDKLLKNKEKFLSLSKVIDSITKNRTYDLIECNGFYISFKACK